MDPGPRATPLPPTRNERIIGTIVLGLLLAGSLAVLRPFLWAAVWAIILSFSLWPVHRRIVGWLKGRRTIAALLITLTIAAGLVVPLTLTVANLSDDARDLAVAGRNWVQSGLPRAPTWIERIPVVGSRVAAFWNELLSEVESVTSSPSSESATTPTIIPDTDFDTTVDIIPTTSPSTAPTTGQSTAPVERPRLRQTFRSILSWTRGWAVAFGLAIGGGVLQVALSLFFMFFILRDGEELAGRLRSMILRISGDRGDKLLDVAGGTVRGVIYGILGTALVQGLMAGVGFLIAGIPGATLLGFLTFVLSPLPVGPPLLWIPASIWLFHRGQTGWGIFMLIWGVGVSSVDNVIKPLIISRGSKMPFILIFFGVLGGAMAFGLIGVFLGPTLLAVVFRLIEEWSRPQVTETR